jgi:hypothetical protein
MHIRREEMIIFGNTHFFLNDFFSILIIMAVHFHGKLNLLLRKTLLFWYLSDEYSNEFDLMSNYEI